MFIYFFHIFYTSNLFVFDKIPLKLDQGYNSKPITVLDYMQFMIFFFAVND